MEKVIKEGQTQVYVDGSIEKQAGVNTDAPYLNAPNQQLIDIVGVLFNQSGKTKLDGKNGKVVESGPMTDSQVLAILVGMGIPQQLGMSAINTFKGNQIIDKKHTEQLLIFVNSLYDAILQHLVHFTWF